MEPYKAPPPKEIKAAIINMLSELDESFFTSMKFEQVGYYSDANDYRRINERVNDYVCTGYKMEISQNPNIK